MNTYMNTCIDVMFMGFHRCANVTGMFNGAFEITVNTADFRLRFDELDEQQALMNAWLTLGDEDRKVYKVVV